MAKMLKKWRSVIAVLLLLSFLLIVINVHHTANDNILNFKIISENISDFYSGSELNDALVQDNTKALKNEILEFSSDPGEGLNVNSTSRSLLTILLVSPVGRSGSSFMGELLGAQEHNIYMYEPIRALKKVEHCLETEVQAELLRNFQCQIRSSFLNYGPKPQVSVRHPYTFGKKRNDVSPSKLKKFCQQEPIRIIKTIRTRLAWTRKLLEDKNLNMKVIHLVRDPRGSYNSLVDLEWQMNPKDMCQKIAEDLHVRQEIEKEFPGQYLYIKYEDFCLNPYTRTSEIFRFLKGESIASSTNRSENFTDFKLLKNVRVGRDQYFPDIPEAVFKYLESHIHINMFSDKSPWSTVRETSSIYQKWRHKITKKELLDIEANCQEVLTILGHRTFGSLENAQNFSISLFL